MSMMWFGLLPKAEDHHVAAKWGARAILHNGPQGVLLDIPGDRQQASPGSPPEFRRFLEGPLTDWLRSGCGQRYIDPASRETFTLDAGRFHARATANASHGYVYIGAHMDAADQPGEEA